MIYIEQGLNTVVLTGTEINPEVSEFWLTVTNQQTLKSLTIPVINLSISDRFDLFEITATLGATGATVIESMTGSTGSMQNMTSGYYEYTLYGPTVSSDNTLEIGKMFVKGYTASPKKEIYNNTQNNIVYNG
jgi:hypothetical protein